MDDENNFISLGKAVKLLKKRYPTMYPTLLQYYVAKGRGPKTEIIAGRRLFRPEDVEAWVKPGPLPPGRPRNPIDGETNV